MTGAVGSWLRRFRPRPTGVTTLYCLPHAGGSASAYFGLATALGDRTDVAAVQYPGRQDRRAEPVEESLAALADRITPILAEDGADGGRFALLGHSMGAMLGFEITRRLEADGLPRPDLLVVSGRRAPSTARRDEGLHRLRDDKLLDAVARLGGDEMPRLTDPDLVALALPAIRGDYRAIGTHPGSDAVVDTPLLVLGGTYDPLAGAGDLHAWAAHTGACLGVHTFTGGHFFLFHHEDDVADLISSTLTPGAVVDPPEALPRAWSRNGGPGVVGQ